MPTDSDTAPTEPRNKRRGFTAIELFCIVAIILLFAGIVLTGFVGHPRPHRLNAAKVQIKTIAISTMSYSTDWNDFPLFDPAIASSNRRGAELLYDYLCVPQSMEGRTVGGYLAANELNLHRGPGLKPALISPLQGFYTFGFEGKDRDVRWVLVDPGSDKLLGGTMSADNGFVPDNADANGDGQADHLDNLIEKVSLR